MIFNYANETKRLQRTHNIQIALYTHGRHSFEQADADYFHIIKMNGDSQRRNDKIIIRLKVGSPRTTTVTINYYDIKFK